MKLSISGGMAWVPFLMASPFLVGCEAKYQEGYTAGYAQGVSETEGRLSRKYEQDLADAKRSQSFSPSYTSVTSTSACGGNGINLNGKHYSGGKTGCVEVFSDGRVVRY